MDAHIQRSRTQIEFWIRSEGKSGRFSWSLQTQWGRLPQARGGRRQHPVHLGHGLLEMLFPGILSSGLILWMVLNSVKEGPISILFHTADQYLTIPSTCVSKNIIDENNVPKSTEKNTSNGQLERSLGTHTSGSWCSNLPMSLPPSSLDLCFFLRLMPLYSKHSTF